MDWDNALNQRQPAEAAVDAPSEHSVHTAQQTIYAFLLDRVRRWPAEDVLLEFKRLFLYSSDSASSQAIDAVYQILFSGNQVEFHNTLKRSCYILVNNWDASRQVEPIKRLIAAFEQPTIPQETQSTTLNRLYTWVEAFKASRDFTELTLFVARYDPQNREQRWATRYTSYLLVPQYINFNNPTEQRQAARTLARQLRHQFKVDLAMYVTRSQSLHQPIAPLQNPTALGDDALRLIKLIVAKRGSYSYVSLANIFLDQVQDVSYAEFKQGLQKYLVFSVDHSAFANTVQTRLWENIQRLYPDYDAQPLTDALILRTVNRLIDVLTTDDRQVPAALFALLLSQGNPLTLVVTLLKLILISRNSRLYLEARIADLIRYYENYPENDCWWVVHFLEIFNVTFTIYSEDIQYNLVKMQQDKQEVGLASQTNQPTHLRSTPVGPASAGIAPQGAGNSLKEMPHPLADLDAYRIFSQLRLYHRDDSDAEIEGLDNLDPIDDESAVMDGIDRGVITELPRVAG
jgi:hypothetical protein